LKTIFDTVGALTLVISLFWALSSGRVAVDEVAILREERKYRDLF
jgi:hypothetical protein